MANNVCMLMECLQCFFFKSVVELRVVVSDHGNLGFHSFEALLTVGSDDPLSRLIRTS